MNNIKNLNKYLVAIDLDGTMLSDIKDKDNNYKVSDINIEAVKKVMKLGHKVCILTGRSWNKRTQTIYESLKLNTIIATNNGAYITHPNNGGFSNHLTTINRKIIHELLTDQNIISKIDNVFIQSCNNKLYVLNGKDTSWFESFHNLGQKFIDFKLEDELKYDHFTVQLKIRNGIKDVEKVSLMLKRKYSNAFDCRTWNISDTECFIEINSKYINKSKAMQFIASYYNIPLSKTISFGDGHNDVEMLKDAEIGVAMKNAVTDVKKNSNDETDYDNTEGGVGLYLKSFFDLD